MPQSGSEPKFEPELSEPDRKFGPKFTGCAEPDHKFGSAFRQGMKFQNLTELGSNRTLETFSL